jgi:hypothetical protein
VVYYWCILLPVEYDCSFFLPSNSAAPKLFVFFFNTRSQQANGVDSGIVPMNSPAGADCYCSGAACRVTPNKETGSHATRETEGKKNDQSTTRGDNIRARGRAADRGGLGAAAGNGATRTIN